MDEGRKKLIYLVAGMFLVRRLAGLDRRPSPAQENAFRDSIDNAVELMRRIDARYPSTNKPRSSYERSRCQMLGANNAEVGLVSYYDESRRDTTRGLG